MLAAPVIDVRHLGVSFRTDEGRVRAVDDVSFAIPPGGTLAVVGESGSGKSVSGLALVRVLPDNAVLDAATEIFLRRRDGTTVDVRGLSPHGPEMRAIRGREIAVVFQEPMSSFSPVYTIGDHIVEAARAHERVSRRDARAWAVDLLDRVGISNPRLRLDQYPYELSGGMRQRAMIAVALAARPSLLIADEPTTALDVTIQAQILELLRSLQREFEMAMLFITHDLGVVAQVADEVLVMYLGRSMELGPTRATLREPRHPYTRCLLRSIPSLTALGSRLTSIGGDIPSPLERPAGCPFHTRCPDRAPGVCDAAVPELRRVAERRWLACAVHAGPPTHGDAPEGGP